MMEKIELLRNLSEGCSKQSNTANRFWLALIITSIITITAGNNNDIIELPFNLGPVKSQDFYTIVIILICVLLISFISALIQSTRARKLMHNLIKEMSADEKFIHNIHIQDIVDIGLSPTYLRVAPISQHILGKNQFHNKKKNNNTFLKFLSFILYIILKILAIVFTYLISICALIRSFRIVQNTDLNNSLGIPNLVLSFLMIITIVVVIISIISDIIYSAKVIKDLNKNAV